MVRTIVGALVLCVSGISASPDECQSRVEGTYCIGPVIAPILKLNHTVLHCPSGKHEVCESGNYCGEPTGDQPGKEQCHLMSEAPLAILQEAVVAKQTQAATCSPCIQLSGQALSTLLNYILNAGVAGTCGKVCSNLKSKREQAACDVICEVVGFKAFVKALNHTDLDPLYFCEEVHACPMAPDNASATIGAVIAQPSSIAKGDTIELVVEVDVKVPSGVGEYRILINGPVTQPVSSSFTLPDGLPVGTQNLAVKIQIKDDDSGDFPTTWSPGSYYFEFEVCQGECGSKHPHSKVFGRKGANFTLTETAEINI